MEATTRPAGPLAWFLVVLGLLFLVVLVVLPMGAIVVGAMAEGWEGFVRGIADPQTLASLQFTLFITLVSLPLAAVFGLAFSWAVVKFRFPGRSLLMAVLDLPLSLSPVLAGISVAALWGSTGLLGPLVESWGLRIIFAWPGVLLTTLFIVTPFVARETIPVLIERGSEEEEAALTLGAHGWYLYRRVTLPTLRTALLYGLVMASARAAGEFGAASIVSGLVRGAHTTLPIHIEILYNDFAATQAFAVSTLFLVFSLITLVLGRLLRPRRNRSTGDRP